MSQNPELIISDDKFFYNKIEDNVTCPICLNMFDDPVNCKQCKNSLCNSHLPTLKRRENDLICPVCNQETRFEPNIILKQIMDKMQFDCPHVHSGCRVKPTYSNFKPHLSRCFFCPQCDLLAGEEHTQDDCIETLNRRIQDSKSENIQFEIRRRYNLFYYRYYNKEENMSQLNLQNQLVNRTIQLKEYHLRYNIDNMKLVILKQLLDIELIKNSFQQIDLLHCSRDLMIALLELKNIDGYYICGYSKSNFYDKINEMKEEIMKSKIIIDRLKYKLDENRFLRDIKDKIQESNNFLSNISQDRAIPILKTKNFSQKNKQRNKDLDHDEIEINLQLHSIKARRFYFKITIDTLNFEFHSPIFNTFKRTELFNKETQGINQEYFNLFAPRENQEFNSFNRHNASKIKYDSKFKINLGSFKELKSFIKSSDTTIKIELFKCNQMSLSFNGISKGSICVSLNILGNFCTVFNENKLKLNGKSNQSIMQFLRVNKSLSNLDSEKIFNQVKQIEDQPKPFLDQIYTN